TPRLSRQRKHRGRRRAGGRVSTLRGNATSPERANWRLGSHVAAQSASMKSSLHAPKLNALKSACSPTPPVPPLGKFPATRGLRSKSIRHDSRFPFIIPGSLNTVSPVAHLSLFT